MLFFSKPDYSTFFYTEFTNRHNSGQNILKIIFGHKFSHQNSEYIRNIRTHGNPNVKDRLWSIEPTQKL